MAINWNLVEVETSDKLYLFGLLSESKNSKTLLINIHGTASNFYENYYMLPLTEKLLKNKISVLSTNNRGAAVMQVYPHSGAALEHFEDCLLDIDIWIEFALSKGYKKIILQGHSLGSEKVVYYMNKGKYRNKIAACILLGPADSYGYTTECSLDKQKLHELLEEAKKLIARGEKESFLNKKWLCHGDTLPKGTDSFLNFFTENSELSKALPLRQGKNLEMYKKINIPILVAIGDEKEYTVIPIKEAIELLKKENKLAHCFQLNNCNHDFEGKEEELADIILNFLLNIKLFK